MPETARRSRSLPIALTMKEAEAIAGALGHPSKMPGFSYGISAQNCQTGGKLRKVPGSVCASCYALTDWYRSWRPLLQGHARRWAGLRHPRWMDAMVHMITARCRAPDDYFRWHDSGDLQGTWHLERIMEVCERTPTVHHWLPTREYAMVAAVVQRRPVPDNLTIRLSAHMIDQEPVFPPELEGVLREIPVSTVSTVSRYHPGVLQDGQVEMMVDVKGSIECRAVEARDNKCGSCRACWSRQVRSVNYPEH